MGQPMPWKDKPVVGIIGLGHSSLSVSSKSSCFSFDTAIPVDSCLEFHINIQSEEISGLV